jgi:hypothetical protein
VLKDSPAYHQGEMGSIPNLSVCDLWKQSWAVTGLFQSTSVSSCLYHATNFVHLPSTFRWRSWLRHCATSRKVASSIPNGVIGIFHWSNPSGRTMALGSTQHLTEMSTKNISWGEKLSVRRTDNLTTFMYRLSWNLGASSSWNPQGLSRPVMGLLYLLPSTFSS